MQPHTATRAHGSERVASLRVFHLRTGVENRTAFTLACNFSFVAIVARIGYRGKYRWVDFSSVALHLSYMQTPKVIESRSSDLSPSRLNTCHT